MKSLARTLPRNTILLMSLLILTLSLNQFALAAPVACSFSIAGGTSLTLDDPATAFTFTVTASQANCAWTAKSNNIWMSVTSGLNYTGTAKVTVSVQANTTTAERIGTLTVAGQVFTVEQQGSCKTYLLGQAIRTYTKDGGAMELQVANIGDCPWTITSENSWVRFNFNGTLEFSTGKTFAITIAPNPGPARTGKIRVQKSYLTTPSYITIWQEGTCSYAVSPTTQSVAGSGGNFSFNVTTHETCDWTASSDSAWAKITSTTGGTRAERRVDYSIAPNTGAARTAKFTVAGKQVTILQAAAQPAPQLLFVNPGFVAAGSSSLTLTLTGNNFTATSQARFDGISLPTTFVSATQLKLSLSEGYLINAANRKITVFDSGAGQASNEQPFLVLSPQTTVSAASYKGEDIAPDSIVAAFGTKLADSLAIAKTVPLPTSLAGTMVRVIDSNKIERLAQLFFVSANQVNYLVPAETALGPATIIIISGSVNISLGYVNIAKVAPGVFTATSNGTGHPSALALRVKANGAQVYETITRFDQASQKIVAVPIDLTVPGEQVFLVLYGTGARNRSGLNAVNLMVGGTPVTTAYAGPSSLAGLDQLNALLPASLAGRGEVDLALGVDGKAANTLKLTFK
jgi:uncharacterized protein (TIGR03437 family)